MASVHPNEIKVVHHTQHIEHLGEVGHVKQRKLKTAFSLS